MKTLSKIAVMALSLFISNGLFAQGKSAGHRNAHINSGVTHSGIDTREQARVNGSVNANAHASDVAKSRANRNSVLNSGDRTIVRRGKKHHHHNRRHHNEK